MKREEEMRLRAAIAATIEQYGGASAHLMPDGTVEVRRPEIAGSNDIERARNKRIDSKKKWRGVTNELVISHANPHCKLCAGHGFTGPEEAGEVCECAEQLFEIAYRGRTRWNNSKRRVEVFA